MKFLKIGNKIFKLHEKTIIMGILNVTPDSFSDGGKFFSIGKAVEHALLMEKQGADIIDIGGESTRPFAKKITEKEEMNRVLPIIEELIKKINIPISIDTYKSKIAKEAIDIGVNMVNDITAFRGDKKMVKIISENNIPICLMHMKGNPQNMQLNPIYKNKVIDEIYQFFQNRIKFSINNGINKKQIIIDPGIGFGKRTGNGIEDNCKILHYLSKLKKFNMPILIGASRKTFIGNILENKKKLPINQRIEGSLAAACIATYNGANIIRTHDVKETRKCLDIIDCILR